MLFKYDYNQLKFKKVKLIDYFVLGVLPMVILASLVYLYGYKKGFDISVDNLSYEEKVLVLEGIDPFSEDKLVDMMQELGIKFPWIPLAQSKLETGNWRGNIFIENNNLFGMKRATRRVTTAKGESKGHAFYDTWRESVYDYAFYQCRYLGTITNEDDYFLYLEASYAEDENYVVKLKNIINSYELKNVFQ